MSKLLFNSFGIDGIVCGVCANELHVDGLESVRYRHDQAVVIALDIENDPAIPEETGATVLILDVRRSFPSSMPDLIHPRLESLLGAREPFPEDSQVADCNDPHDGQYSPNMGYQQQEVSVVSTI
jgi:hypothetical protein